MSRIGRMPISVPAGVEITIGADNLVTVKGPKGTLTQQLSPAMTIAQEGLTLPAGSFFHLLVFLTLIGGALQQRRDLLRPGQILRRVPASGLPAGSPHLPSPHLISRIIAMEVLHHD